VGALLFALALMSCGDENLVFPGKAPDANSARCGSMLMCGVLPTSPSTGPTCVRAAFADAVREQKRAWPVASEGLCADSPAERPKNLAEMHPAGVEVGLHPFIWEMSGKAFPP
jgi:hypothetical protein